MHVVGIVGGVASGKSLVAECFRRLGAEVIRGDEAGHTALREDEVKQAAKARWGEKIFDASGEISRPALARIVFGPGVEAAGELKYLESLTHPRIQRILKQRLEKLSSGEGPPVAVIDAALLIEAGWDRFCDTIVFVDTPRDERLARARLRGWDAEGFASREAAQVPPDEKRRRAHRVVDNSGTPEDTQAQVEEIWHSLWT